MEIIIDPEKRKQEVEDIVDSDCFQDLNNRAVVMHGKRDYEDDKLKKK